MLGVEMTLRSMLGLALALFGGFAGSALAVHIDDGAPRAAAIVASDFSEPWKRLDRALVIDAYEYNPIDWQELTSDKRIVGFINKASDGLPPAYRCSGDAAQKRLCKTLWRRHAVAQELFQTRRTLAKALGLKWGAYHLGRPGNPIEQARNFLDFAKPASDDLMAIDIEDDDPEKWMSLTDAETFATEIQRRTGRYPILYTNGKTAKHIADNRLSYPLLSRLPLWYARYKPEIGMHFPKGNWDSYTLWQFSAQANCNAKACPYRIKGAKHDIDVNVATVDADTLRTAWPFGGLLGVPVDLIASVPVPVERKKALQGNVETIYAPVALLPGSAPAIAYAYVQAGNRYPEAVRPVATVPKVFAAMASAFASEPALTAETEPEAFRSLFGQDVDPVTTASVEPSLFKRDDFPIFLLETPNRRR
jgi:GH25 family lysozyme M1 (1,4-beta-N-acetylmuramidase)